ncbi:hypothetical protein RND59_09090 [Vibrio ruber]|uniref:hypothetical protein n=1 Tax=Vibrio ruber TaxID=184755 RepID=UPI0028934304|nr:hypothetical protein [Vibrio ruber]WNJ94323.1 hypothetical protein RND59_09090 [Vibrio ruber]
MKVHLLTVGIIVLALTACSMTAVNPQEEYNNTLLMTFDKNKPETKVFYNGIQCADEGSDAKKTRLCRAYAWAEQLEFKYAKAANTQYKYNTAYDAALLAGAVASGVILLGNAHIDAIKSAGVFIAGVTGMKSYHQPISRTELYLSAEKKMACITQTSHLILQDENSEQQVKTLGNEMINSLNILGSARFNHYTKFIEEGIKKSDTDKEMMAEGKAALAAYQTLLANRAGLLQEAHESQYLISSMPDAVIAATKEANLAVKNQLLSNRPDINTIIANLNTQMTNIRKSASQEGMYDAIFQSVNDVDSKAAGEEKGRSTSTLNQSISAVNQLLGYIKFMREKLNATKARYVRAQEALKLCPAVSF